MIPSCAVLASPAVASGGGGGGGGGGAATITITNQSVTKSARFPTSAVATYTVDSDGTVTKNATATFIENWISDPTQAANYDVRATLSSGSTPSGTLGSWLSLASDRSWSLTNSAGDGSTISCVLTVEIRLRSSGVVQDSATITISATNLEDITP